MGWRSNVRFKSATNHAHILNICCINMHVTCDASMTADGMGYCFWIGSAFYHITFTFSALPKEYGNITPRPMHVDKSRELTVNSIQCLRHRASSPKMDTCAISIPKTYIFDSSGNEGASGLDWTQDYTTVKQLANGGLHFQTLNGVGSLSILVANMYNHGLYECLN